MGVLGRISTAPRFVCFIKEFMWEFLALTSTETFDYGVELGWEGRKSVYQETNLRRRIGFFLLMGLWNSILLRVTWKFYSFKKSKKGHFIRAGEEEFNPYCQEISTLNLCLCFRNIFINFRCYFKKIVSWFYFLYFCHPCNLIFSEQIHLKVNTNSHDFKII